MLEDASVWVRPGEALDWLSAIWRDWIEARAINGLSKFLFVVLSDGRLFDREDGDGKQETKSDGKPGSACGSGRAESEGEMLWSQCFSEDE